MVDMEETGTGDARRDVGPLGLPDGAGVAPSPEPADAMCPSASQRETRVLRRWPLAA